MPAAFRYPYDISTTLEPWRKHLGDAFDDVVALLIDRDRALEDRMDEDYGHTHDGAGTDAVTLGGDTQSTAPIASGAEALAAGNAASATGAGAVAIGPDAEAPGDAGTAVGDTSYAALNGAAFGAEAIAVGDDATALGAEASAAGDGGLAAGFQAYVGPTGGAGVSLGYAASVSGLDGVAIGANSIAPHAGSVALGEGVTTTAIDQFNVGPRRTFLGAPSTAPAVGSGLANQITFYLDEASNTLVFRVKDSGGTAKTGTVAIS